MYTNYNDYTAIHYTTYRWMYCTCMKDAHCTELEITAGHWPFSEQTADLTEHFTECSVIVAHQATR